MRLTTAWMITSSLLMMLKWKKHFTDWRAENCGLKGSAAGASYSFTSGSPSGWLGGPVDSRLAYSRFPESKSESMVRARSGAGCRWNLLWAERESIGFY